MSRARKLGYSLLLFFCFLVVLEIALRLLGFFSPQGPFTVREELGKKIVRYEWNTLRPEFYAEKEKGAVRIFVAGGSTALGFPYHPRSSIGARLALMLREALPGRKFEVINIARMGMNSREVKEAVAAALDFSPDLVVVYSGQNELISLLRRFWRFDPFALERPRGFSKLRIYQAGRRAFFAILGGLTLSAMKGMDRAETGELLPPRPTPVSRDAYARAVKEHKQNLRELAELCRKAHVPLVLSTLVWNLRDWPPDQNYPGRIRDPAAEKQIAQELKTAKSLLDSGHCKKALETISRVEARYPSEAMLWFKAGRLETEAVKRHLFSTGEEEGTGLNNQGEEGSNEENSWSCDDPAMVEELRKRALLDFKRALAEEAKTVLANRAPPELNDNIRRVAEEEGAWLFDAEKFIEESSYFAPGFDWFEDHCHPNLWAQQALAEGLFDVLKEHEFIAPWEQWKEPGPWDEETFQKEQGVTPAFLHDIYIRMAVYLGLEKSLPEKSKATREKLQKAAELAPEDPLPPVLEALVAAHYGEVREAGSILADLYEQRLPALKKCLNRYLARAELRQGVFMARLNQDPELPPLRGLLKSGLFQNESSPGHEKRELSWFNLFLDLEERGADITGKMKQRIGRAERASPSGPIALADAREGKVLKPGPGVKLLKVSEQGAAYQVQGPDAALSTGLLNLDPLAFSRLALVVHGEARSPLGNSPRPELEVITLSSNREQSRFFVPLLAEEPGVEASLSNNQEQYRVNLRALPRWMIAERILEIKVRPGMERGIFTIVSMTLSSE